MQSSSEEEPFAKEALRLADHQMDLAYAAAEREAEDHPPALSAQAKEIQTRLAAAMERLSPRERIVFEMKHYQGLKLRAIGDALGTSEETVKNSLFRATRKLRSELGVLR